MKFNLHINQPQALNLGIKNATEALILDLLSVAPTWAESVVLGGEVFYWTARQKIAHELPLLSLKPDTVYRCFKTLEAKGLIEYKKQYKKDCIRLTEKGKQYTISAAMSENNSSQYGGKKSDSEAKSKNNPNSYPGKKSEYSLENDPIYSSTIFHSSASNPGEEKESFRAFVERIRKNYVNQKIAYAIPGYEEFTIFSLDPSGYLKNDFSGKVLDARKEMNEIDRIWRWLYENQERIGKVDANMIHAELYKAFVGHSYLDEARNALGGLEQLRREVKQIIRDGAGFRLLVRNKDGSEQQTEVLSANMINRLKWVKEEGAC